MNIYQAKVKAVAIKFIKCKGCDFMTEFLSELNVLAFLVFLIIFFTGVFGFGKRKKDIGETSEEPPPAPTENKKDSLKGSHHLRKRIRVCIRKKKRKLKRIIMRK